MAWFGGIIPLHDLDASFRDWNAVLNEAGLIVPKLLEEDQPED